MSNYLLPLDMVDRAGRLIYQLTGLLDLIGAASMGQREPADESIEAATWLARDLLEEVKAVCNAKAQT